MAAYATDFVEKTWPLSYRSQPKESEIDYPSEGRHAIANSAGGYIWDRCKEAGVSYRSFGEWVENGPTPDSPGTAKAEALKGHIDPLYRSFDLDYSDLKRADRFIHELARFERDDNLPQLVILRLPNDHTAGTKEGSLTPTSMLAQNDSRTRPDCRGDFPQPFLEGDGDLCRRGRCAERLGSRGCASHGGFGDQPVDPA